MKRAILFILIIFLLTGVCLADGGGDPNIDGGGGGMGEGNNESKWSYGNDGVRVTVIKNGIPIYTMDLANKNFSDSVQRCFIKNSKLSYSRGTNLVPTFPYINIVPPGHLPTIISKDGSSTIDSIRSYFTDKKTAEFIAQVALPEGEELTNGSYKLLLEPIAYFKYKGVMYAMTATEAALYDKKVEGDLKYWMGRLTHQNLPFSMFLERADLGFQPWSGAITGKQDDDIILSYLGVGIVSFHYTPEDEPEAPVHSDYTYRTDTDVITPILVRNSGQDITPDTDAYVTFSILGRTYRKKFVCPQGGSQLVWVRWHTPTTAQDFTIYTSSPSTKTTASIPVSVGPLPDKVPPNPIYDGPGIDAGQYQPNFRLSTVPDWGCQTTAQWRQWYTTWNEPIIVTDEDGEDVILPGYWSFDILEYGASLAVSYDLLPSERCPTAFARGMGQYEIKAGYGVRLQCTVKVTGIGGVSNSDVTPAQSGLAVFPDWKFERYDRILEAVDPGHYMSDWGFRINPYSYYGERVHYTPIWYPPEKYPVPIAIFDVWTPAGQLYASASDYVDVRGDMLDDWYIRVIEG